jgi:hypothetical protein
VAVEVGIEAVEVGRNKRQVFKRLAEKRTNAVLERVRILANCANPYAYEYTDEEVKAIFAAIDRELKVAKAKFASHRRRRFRLGAE